MIEIYVGGNICYESSMDLNMLYTIMSDSFVSSDTFIEFTLSDGCTAYAKKGSIISFNAVEVEESR
jgi:hypothetical protein